MASALINLEHVQALEVKNFDPTRSVFGVYASFGPDASKLIFRGSLDECDLHLGRIWHVLTFEGFGVPLVRNPLNILNGPGLVPDDEPQFIPGLVVTDDPR